VAVFTVVVARRYAVAAAGGGDVAAADDDSAAPPPPLGRVYALAGAFAMALVVAIAAGPSTPHGAAPSLSPWLWLIPAAPMVVALVMLARSVRFGALIPLAVVAVLYGAFLLDRYLPDLGPHWSQKHVIASYYAHRTGPEEPLIVYNLYWRGENFYTRNEIYDHTKPQLEKTIFLGDRNVEKMQAYLKAHPGRRVFFLVERVRFEALRGLLPVEARPTLQIVDQTNNKLYLATAQLGESAPLGPRTERLDHDIR
jgi:hypothetical protein